MSSNPTLSAMEKNRAAAQARIKQMYIKAEQTCLDIMSEKVEAHAAMLDEIEELERMLTDEHQDMAVLIVRLEVAKRIVKAINRDIKDLQELIDGHAFAIHETTQSAQNLIEHEKIGPVDAAEPPRRQARRRNRREFDTFENLAEFEAMADQNTQPAAGEGATAEVKNEDIDDDAPFTQLVKRETTQPPAAATPTKTPPRPKPKMKAPALLKVITSDVKPPPLE